MKLDDFSRRQFLLQTGGAVGAAWVSVHWPAILDAATHAHQAAKSPTAVKFEVFTPEQAAEVEAIAARIIPSGDAPGAREAGVVYFIDRALGSFASDSLALYQDGLADLQDRVRGTFPGIEKFSLAAPEQQDAILHALDVNPTAPNRPRRAPPKEFFDVVRAHTITGFLVDPEGGGNRGGVGWKLIGREPEHMFQPPFGFYDKDYPGWQPLPKDADKK